MFCSKVRSISAGTLPPRFRRRSQIFTFVQLLFVVVLVTAANAGATIVVTVSPTTATLTSNQQLMFLVGVSGTPNSGVTATATAGTISGSTFTAPVVTVQTIVTVTFASKANPSKKAKATVTVNPAGGPPLAITTFSLPTAPEGGSYNEVLAASGGTAPYNWSVSSGTPPPGLSLSASGNLSGQPTTLGTYDFAVTVSDAKNHNASANFSVIVVPYGSNFDGPAELPRVTVPSAMADTPAPGSIINVNAGGNLQTVLNNANCGDTIELQAGATFSGVFTLPFKNCDNNHWVIVRTSAPDSALPLEGQRATPCYANVAALAGRPAYSCASPSKAMAKVQQPIKGDGPFLLANGAAFYRFIGLEITRPAGAPGSARLISGLGRADHFIVDRCWLHGALQDETKNALTLDGMTNVAVVDSYLSDFHCIAVSGTCTDSHAISGGNSNTQDGPFKIEDNFLEASGEEILFGGGPATMTPADIQILNNHFWKPWQWWSGDANFIGGPDGHAFIVKNHLELKNATRVQIEANLMENNWGGFTQTGYGILLTPLNQATKGGSGPFVCPQCQVSDVTIRYVHLSHAGGGIQMATAEDVPNGKGQPALAGTRWSIHDVVIDDLSKTYGGGTAFEIANGWEQNGLNTVTINHVTAFSDSAAHMMIVGNPAGNDSMYGLVFTNNVVLAGKHPIWNADAGSTDCAGSNVPATIISNCFSSYAFVNNAVIATPAGYPASSWPANNFFPATASAVAFTSFANGNGGNYELQASSPYKNKGSDGKDLGADIVGLNSALASVE